MPESKNLQRLIKPKYQEKLRNARLHNNDKNPVHLPRQRLKYGEKDLIL